MAADQPVRVGIVGCGGRARYHLEQMLKQQDTTQVVAISEPSSDSYSAAAKLFKDTGVEAPPNQPDWSRFLTDFGDRLDAAFIISPHVYHYEQAKACLQAGLDVLLEKPMVMNANEARGLIEARDRTGKLLVVAFPGSLSHQIRNAVEILRSGELGSVLNINAMVWQNWNSLTAGSWRQQPEIAGGGFLFDTGAHMLNSIADLAGEDFVEVAAWMDNRGRAVDILAVVIGRLASGTLVTMNACGDASTIDSDIRLICTKGMVRTGIWGERLEVQRAGEESPKPIAVPASGGDWEQFLAVRRGAIPNPCPPEVGLRMALLWDAIKASAAQNGAPVRSL
jgi:predicted dehydrogenase